MDSEYNEEAEKKAEMMKKINEMFWYRAPLVPLAIVFFIFANFIFKPYSASYIVYFTIFVASGMILPVIYFIKKKANSLSSRNINSILAGDFIVETVLVFIIFYFWKPVITYYVGGGTIFFLGLVFCLWVISAGPIFDIKIYRQIFLFIGFIILIIFELLEYLGIYPVYPSYPVESLYHTGNVVALCLSLVMVITMLIIIYNRFDKYWEMLRKKTTELRGLNIDLDQKVNERTSALEEAKVELEKKVEERTKELNEKVEELEKFRKLSVGRELRMIELKKAIQDDEERIAELNMKIEELGRKR
jgi:hypothetical protein